MDPLDDPTSQARSQASARRPRAGGNSGADGDPPLPGEPEDVPEHDLSRDENDAQDSPVDETSSETSDETSRQNPQPFDEDGVQEDMATAAYDRTWPGAAHFPDAVRAGALPLAPPEDGSDAAIMLRVRDGDDSGFTYLIEKYRKQIVHHMFRMTSNQAIAEELAQEVFLRVYRSRESYRAEAKFSTWLYRIATNLGVNHARDHRHERSAQSVYLDQPDAETGTTPDVADNRLTAEQGLLRNERMAGIRGAVLALPERQRQAVLMHKYQDMDYREIGAVLKLSESATKSLLFRAYQTLRERLKEYV